ncbi:iron ABC transporter permease [Domibacillus sp. A3M-37]|uniref:FecCD family ABC transporter permease n=1 Tax=Domibacillus sp. A3M-37 TaxID=2962037 RepID=UPI0020B88B2E|nr:iron ABC transporter permease [Domibacillus sp. A3M-37]MCP3762432.1 iron ABC transporter permease [Domibacillus sp. A3M-37]
MNNIKEPAITSRPKTGVFVILAGFAGLLFSLALSVSVGAAELTLKTVWEAIFSYNPSREADQIIIGIRLPREVGAALTGAAFATAGAIMQGITRNPLAEPGLLGLNAGASFGLACLLAFFTNTTYIMAILFSFLGASLGASLLFGLASLKKGGFSPLRIVLAGAAISALLTALGEGVAIMFKLSQDLAFWMAGGVSGTSWSQLQVMAPIVGMGLLTAIFFSRSLTLLSFGDEMAKGLGQRTTLIKVILIFAVLVLAGAAVSVAGPIMFVGLMTPHIVRALVGTDYRWIIPGSALAGGILLVLADTTARMINPPFETPVGAVISIIGVPFFLYLIRKRGRLTQ